MKLNVNGKSGQMVKAGKTSPGKQPGVSKGGALRAKGSK